MGCVQFNEQAQRGQRRDLDWKAPDSPGASTWSLSGACAGSSLYASFVQASGKQRGCLDCHRQVHLEGVGQDHVHMGWILIEWLWTVRYLSLSEILWHSHITAYFFFYFSHKIFKLDWFLKVVSKISLKLKISLSVCIWFADETTLVLVLNIQH